MDKTIEVIEDRIGVMPDGTTASMFSAGLSEIKKTGKYTWRVTDHRGGSTVGMSRMYLPNRLKMR